MTQKLELVARAVREVAHFENKRLDMGDAELIATIALKPAKIASNESRWLEVVVRGLHTNYAGAVKHYIASIQKHGGEA